MPTQEQMELMSKLGYTITKTDPLILVHKDGGIATRKAAKLLIESVHLNQVMNKRLNQLEARLNTELPTKVTNRTPFGSNEFLQSLFEDE